MPLPLPNLDTRRWADLVDEGRALVPRFAPEWTDHNIHDPGITLIELFAWLTEREMYRANRVPERHRRKFLQLIGFAPRPPLAATVVLGMTPAPGAGVVRIPAGLVLHAGAAAAATGAASVLPFVTTEAATLIEAELAAVQVFDGERFLDRTRAARERLPFPALGADPRVPAGGGVERSPALYFGFDRALPVGRTLRLHLVFDGAMADERERLRGEARAQAEACTPSRYTPSCVPCPPREHSPCDGDADAEEEHDSPADVLPTAVVPVTPPHHSARVVWEYRDATGWRQLSDGGEVVDETRTLTLDGAVQLTLPATTAATAIGAVSAPRHWVRCRLVAGPYDAAPVVVGVVVNAVNVAQRISAWRSMPIAAGAVVTGTITPGAAQRLSFQLTAAGEIQSLTTLAAADAPEHLVLDYTAPSATAAGAITLPVVPALLGTGLPEQHATLPDAPVADGETRVWTIEGGAWLTWVARADLDAAGARDRVAALEPVRGSLVFGDGERGRVPPAGAPMLVAYDTTAGERGNVPAGRAWSVADNPLNRVLLGGPVAPFAARITAIANTAAAEGGADAESVDHAAGRAAAALWAHERLVELMAAKGGDTLDQVERDEVLRRAAPPRGTTLIDLERIALDVPGTRVRRARAWAGIDPAYPCVQVAGTVTLVVVPELPRGRPTPSRGLIAAVRRYMSRRRVLCTRLVIVGPTYVEVRAKTVVRALPGADPARVRADVATALVTFLDPLRGGPAGLGWPFGRDVYRSEILALIDGVHGVDHVLALELSVGDETVRCGNVCVPVTGLTTSGAHLITVEGA